MSENTRILLTKWKGGKLRVARPRIDRHQFLGREEVEYPSARARMACAEYPRARPSSWAGASPGCDRIPEPFRARTCCANTRRADHAGVRACCHRGALRARGEAARRLDPRGKGGRGRSVSERFPGWRAWPTAGRSSWRERGPGPVPRAERGWDPRPGSAVRCGRVDGGPAGRGPRLSLLRRASRASRRRSGAT